MANLLLPNKITGLNTHMRISSSGEVLPTYTIESMDIVIGSKDWNSYLKTMVVEPPFILPEPQRKAIQTILNLEERNKIIPLKHILPLGAFSDAISSYCTQMSEYLRRNSTNYFENFLKVEMQFLSELYASYIDEEKYSQYLIEDQQGLVKTFTPNRHGYSKVVSYDHFKSPTGRLVVVDGPHVLTINKKYRDMITSSFGTNGAIISVDYVSLEPNVLLHRSVDSLSNWLSSTQGSTKGTTQDIYEGVSDALLKKGILNSPLSREESKAVVLRTLYGAQEDLIGQIVQGKNSVPLHDFLFEVRELFDINRLLEKLQDERKSNGGTYITNHYGRRIPTSGVEDYKLVNYWTQSTAVDVALLGFSKIAEECKAHKIRPLFVIHDALFLDVDKSALSVLPHCLLEGKGVPLFSNEPFALKVTRQT